MKARSVMISTHRDDGSRLSSSLPLTLPQPVLSQGTPAPSLSPNAPPSFTSRRGESTLDESLLARRTTAQRQLLGGNQNPLLRRLREPKDSKRMSQHSSTLASQPVLVRSYSPETDDDRHTTNMSKPQMQQVDLPSVEEFGIEAILRAIEPDIRSTLDSIAEICGRSKLSLANEYGSHIAPFGEINPPASELIPIQESTPSNAEGLADVDSHIVIVDDDNDLYGSPSGLLDNLRQTAFATGYQQTSRIEIQTSHSHRPSRGQSSKNRSHSPVTSVTRTEEFATTSKPGGKALLGNVSAIVKTTKPANKKTMTSPALLSETHLDAQGNRSSWPSEPPDTPQGSPMLPASSFIGERNGHNQSIRVDRLSLMADVQDWLSWLKMIIQREKSNQQTFLSQSHSAEQSLRSLLVRDQDQAVAVPTA